jgi:hypothetical protein
MDILPPAIRNPPKTITKTTIIPTNPISNLVFEKT